MKIVYMIHDYHKLCVNCHEVGNFEAYKKYTLTYKSFFDAVFKYLYCTPADTLCEYIEGMNFDRFLQQAESNYDQGICDYIIAVAQKTAEEMKVRFDFELLLGMELSNISGCSVPREDHVPYLYIGVDRSLTKEFIDMFVPHEMYHMVRCHLAPQASSETLLSRAVEEGLASFVPMWMNNMEWNADSVSKVLSVQPQQAEYLLTHTDQIVESVLKHGDEPLTSQVMQDFFSVTDANAQLALPGYYVGLYLTRLAVKNGVDFNQFSSMPGNDVIALLLKYDKIRKP